MEDVAVEGRARRRAPHAVRPTPLIHHHVLRRVTGLQSGLYSLLTPTLALAGASYLFAPGMSLAEVFG